MHKYQNVCIHLCQWGMWKNIYVSSVHSNTKRNSIKPMQAVGDEIWQNGGLLKEPERKLMLAEYAMK